MAKASTQLLLLFTLVTITIVLVKGHAYLEVPPSRNSVGVSIKRGECQSDLDTNPNYRRSGLNCGRKKLQKQLQGKCGACGDAYNTFPRPHETGGKYSANVLTYAYTTECTLSAQVQLTGPHGGWFEFRLCHDVNPNAGSTTSAPTDLDDCFQKEHRHRLLSFSDNTNRTGDVGTRKTTMAFDLKLPKGIICKHCVLQWKYHATNGEEFYNCADIAIYPRDTDTIPEDILICNDVPNVAEQCPPPNPKQSEPKGRYDYDSYEDSYEEDYDEDVESNDGNEEGNSWDIEAYAGNEEGYYRNEKGYEWDVTNDDGDEESNGWDVKSDDGNEEGYDGNNEESSELDDVAGPADKDRIQFSEEESMLFCVLLADHRTANPLVKKCCRRVCQGDNEEVCTWLYTC